MARRGILIKQARAEHHGDDRASYTTPLDSIDHLLRSGHLWP